MSTAYWLRCEEEIQKLLTQTTFDKKFIEENEQKVKKIFKRIYVINLLKNRPECRSIMDNTFDMTFTLLLESTYSLFCGQCRASLLLLRSSLESGLKFVLEKERQWINENFDPKKTFEDIDYRFSETKRKLVYDIGSYVSNVDFPDYYLTIDRCTTYYKQLCGVVHSTSKSLPISFSYYYENLEQDTLIKKDDFFKLYLDSLDSLFTLLYFLLRERLNNWDTYELTEILRLLFKNSKVNRYLRYVKKDN